MTKMFTLLCKLITLVVNSFFLSQSNRTSKTNAAAGTVAMIARQAQLAGLMLKQAYRTVINIVNDVFAGLLRRTGMAQEAPPDTFGSYHSTRSLFKVAAMQPVRVYTNTTPQTTRMKQVLLSAKSRALCIAILLISVFGTTQASAQIAQRGTATTATSTSGNTLTINKPTGVAAGDVMIAVISKAATTTNSSLTGWTLISGAQQSTGSRYTTVLYKVADGTEGANFGFAIGSTNVTTVGSIIAFSGADVNSPFDVTPGALTTGGATSASVTGITTSTNGAAIIYIAGAGSGGFSNWSGTNPTLTEILDFASGSTVST